MTLGEWFNLAIYLCGFLAGVAALACAIQIRRTMPTGLPAALVTEGDETQRGTNLTNTDSRNSGASPRDGVAHAR